MSDGPPPTLMPAVPHLITPSVIAAPVPIAVPIAAPISAPIAVPLETPSMESSAPMSVAPSACGSTTTRRIANKICRICGDRAHGFNFNVVSCESCKAFFRRWALANKQLKCPYEENCVVNQQSRRMCKKCRMSKCFAEGMSTSTFAQTQSTGPTPNNPSSMIIGQKRSLNSESPPPDPQKPQNSINSALLNNMIEAQRNNMTSSLTGGMNVYPLSPMRTPTSVLSKLTAGMYSSPSSMESPLLPIRSTADPSPAHKRHNSISNGACAPGRGADSKGCVCRCTCGIFPHDMKYTDVIDKVSREVKALVSNSADPRRYSMSPTLDFLNYSINCQLNAGLPVCDHTMPGARPPQERPVWLSDDVVRVEEIVAAVEWLSLPSQLPPPEIAQASVDDTGMPLWDQQKMLQIMDHSIKRLIDLAKHFSSFRALPQDDQMTLLKGGTVEMQMLKGAMNYDHVREGFHSSMPAMNGKIVPLEILKRFSTRMYDHHKRFLATFDPKMLADPPLMIILMLITLFNSQRRFLQQPDVVAAERAKYEKMLENHLKHKYDNTARGRYLFHVLMAKVDELSEAKSNAISFFTSVDTNAIEPLLLEIFDLR